MAFRAGSQTVEDKGGSWHSSCWKSLEDHVFSYLKLKKKKLQVGSENFFFCYLIEMVYWFRVVWWLFKVR